MDPERWRRIEDLFLQAVVKDAEARSVFLDDQCGPDTGLRREVDRLLEADARAAERLAGVVGGAVRSFHQILPAGTRLGPYEIVERVGEGGMGRVYRARRSDDVFDKDVAIKVVKQGMGSEDTLRRFQRERRILAQLEHPGIARILDGGSTEDGLPYLVMEYVDGRNVLDHANERRLDLRARLELFLQVCDAVECAHQSQIVHRDLKPNNILIDANGRPRLLDFGIAKLVGTFDESPTMSAGGWAPLTPRYASPEQVKAEAVTPASDVYSLGVILYELVTGCAVHRIAGDAPGEIVRAVCDELSAPPSQAARMAQQSGRSVPVPPAALLGDLDRVVLMALEKDPRRRYGSAKAFADDIRRCLEASTEGERPSPASRAARLPRSRKVALIATSVAALAALLFAAAAILRGPTRADAPAGKIMLAVLPLENLTGSDERQPFIEGLHEEIISRLGRLQPERLGVLARTSVLQYRDTTTPVVDIGRQLGAHYVLEGSVRQSGQRVVVTAQFIQVSDQTHLWAQTFEREIGDLFSVQAEIGGYVADSLQLEVLPSARAALDPHDTLGAEAYAAYLRGRYYWHRRWMDYPANAERALARFQEVVAAAPSFADGHAALGQTYQYLSVYPAARAERQALLDKARAALSRSLALDPLQASARATQAWMTFRNDWSWAGAEQGFREALQRDPNNADIHQQLATLLAYAGRHPEADREIRLAQELDPLSPTLHVSAFFVHMSGRRWEKAEATARKVAELIPGGTTHIYFASLVEALRGRCDAALVQLDRAKDLVLESETGSFAEEHLGGYVLGRCGKAAEARRLVAALERRPDYFAHRIAIVHAGLGDVSRALHWLEESLRRREEMLTSIQSDPKLDGLRGEPRFQRLLQAVGFPAR